VVEGGSRYLNRGLETVLSTRWDLVEYQSRPYRNPTLVHTALGYADQGLRVIPLDELSKEPWRERWHQRATCDPDQIVRWLEACPRTNIGLAMGDGYFALDVDPRNGGHRSLVKLFRGRTMPFTAMALTGGGGHHYLFRVEPGVDIAECPSFLPGIDLKGRGGQIVVEPSVHPRTRREYVWLVTPQQRIAEAPGWLLEFIAEYQRERRPRDGDHPRLILDRLGEEWPLAQEVIGKFPVTATGQRNGVMSKVIASLLGRGYEAELSCRVVMGWYQHYRDLGVIGTGRREAERAARANIDSTIRKGSIRRAVSLVDHQSNIASLSWNQGRGDQIRESVLHSGTIILPEELGGPPPPSKSRTKSTFGTAHLCRTANEYAFVESLAACFAYKHYVLGEPVMRTTGQQIARAIQDRHGISLDLREIGRMKSKYVRCGEKVPTRFELAVQTLAGHPGVASEFELTGLLGLMTQPMGLVEETPLLMSA
jgi:Bifunctional DNA primase/polymerase, N-terminal